MTAHAKIAAEQQDLLTQLADARERCKVNEQISVWCLELQARLRRAEKHLLHPNCRTHHAALATEIERLRLCIRLARKRRS